MVSGFLIGSEDARRRTLRRTGGTVVAAVVVAILVALYVIPRFGDDDADRITLTIETPAVGPGVEAGTEVMLRGAPVGLVRTLDIDDYGTATLTLDLDKNAVNGLGRDFVMDFRPKNYFGITGVTIADPGAGAGGVVHDGDHLSRAAGYDATMAAMIERGSDVANGTLLPSTTDAVRRVLVYTGAFEPLLHTGVVVADVVARTQRAMPRELLAEYNRIVDALPPFSEGAIGALFAFYNSELRAAGDEVQNNFTVTLKAISDNFFSMVGRLLESNQANLTSTVQVATEAASILPALGPGLTPVTVRELVAGLDGAFSTKPDGTTTLRIELALQRLPALAGPIAGTPVTGGR
ncbi:MlaD family protein [Gordonia sp. NPDC003376]